MSLAYADIEIPNHGDFALVNRAYMRLSKIRKTAVKSGDDEGVYPMFISETLAAKLGLWYFMKQGEPEPKGEVSEGDAEAAAEV
jgi:hypothetical protein